MACAVALLAALGREPKDESEYVRAMTGALSIAGGLDDLRVIKTLLKSALTK